MLSEVDQKTGGRFLLIAACIVVIVHGMRAAAPILLSFLLALFLAVLSLPLLLWLRRHRIPTLIAVMATVLSIGALVGSVLLVVGRTFEEFVKALPSYVISLQGMTNNAIQWLDERGIMIGEWVTTDYINPSRIMDFVGGTLLGLATLLSFVFIVLIIMVFVLAEATAFPQKIRAALGRVDADLGRFREITQEVQRYLRIKTLISLATGVLVGVWVWALGIEFPLLWGLVAFLFNYIPNIGSIVASVPPVMLGLLQFGLSRALLVIAGYFAVNISLGNLLEPQLMGRKLGLSPLMIVLSLMFWGWVWGVLGMLLAVPLTMSIRIMLEYSEDFRWVAILLGGEPEEAAETAGPGPEPEGFRETQ